MHFFTELRRRKVIQTAILYAVSAWVLLQVAELLRGPTRPSVMPSRR